ncbi:MAG: ribosome small subunit-dependent GTPase A [Firmicutes bacterium]|nr:ribosome small subunit-dependent GTPase A [Bacillota bacterium]
MANTKAEKGIVVKGIGGFYFVDTGKEVFRTRGRGILKRDKSLIMVGDMVEATPPLPGDDDGVILNVFPRKNSFSRPPVANLDKLVVTFSVADPKPNLEVIDRLLVMAESKEIDPLVCINKADKSIEGEVEKLYKIYSPIYPTVVTCCKDNEIKGIDELKALIGESKAALAGPSGVGKSSLTNLLIPEAEMETGDISKKTQRGKHTTRHVELFSVGEGYLYDTPGFTSFDLQDIKENELQDYFPEIKEAARDCKFPDCFHLKEPECGVKSALDKGLIAQERYNSYVSCLEEIRKNSKY